MRGRRLLAEADVVVTDRLGPTGVLGELAPDVEVIDVGQAPRPPPRAAGRDQRASWSTAPGAGSRVVRLKGGDPFVYGRGGEEVAACLAAGVPVDVVPGLTSVVSVPQAAGIPVTHRGTAAALHVVNGQDAPTEATLAALRDAADDDRRADGRAALSPASPRRRWRRSATPTCPVAIVESGPHRRAAHDARDARATAASAAAAAGVRNPAVMVFGHVAAADLLLPALIVGCGR